MLDDNGRVRLDGQRPIAPLSRDDSPSGSARSARVALGIGTTVVPQEHEDAAQRRDDRELVSHHDSLPVAPWPDPLVRFPLAGSRLVAERGGCSSAMFAWPSGAGQADELPPIQSPLFG